MRFKDILSIFAVLLVLGAFLLVIPQKAYSGGIPALEGCCQFEVTCENFAGPGQAEDCSIAGGEVFVGLECNADSGLCEGDDPPPPSSTNVPTLGEWGLIALAGILGIIGFVVIRKRKATA